MSLTDKVAALKAMPIGSKKLKGNPLTHDFEIVDKIANVLILEMTEAEAEYLAMILVTEQTRLDKKFPSEKRPDVHHDLEHKIDKLRFPEAY